MHKVNTRLGNDDNQKFQSYPMVLPRTFSIPLLPVWENIIVDFPLQANTVAAFHDQLKHFFAANSSERDRHKLIEFVRKASKPVTLSVQAFFYRLRELNDQAAWLPGQANVLTAAQIDQAFFDWMPVSWRNRYSNAGHTLQHDNHATLLRFFRLQEHTSEKSQRDNNKQQRQNRSKRQREVAANRFNDKAKGKDEDGNKKRPRRNGGRKGDKRPRSRQIPSVQSTPKETTHGESATQTRPTRTSPSHQPTRKPWRIYLPDALHNNAIRWYHVALSHIGTRRLYDTMSMMFYHPKLKTKIEAIVAPCALCQQYKNVQRGHGETAPREAALLPWSEIAVDTIGPWTLEVAYQKVTFHALTIIDLVTNLVKVVCLDNRTSAHVAMQFVNTWLARYPKPTSCIFDQGGEFTRWAFQHMLEENDICRRPATTKNPQASAICEWMHQSIGNSLRILHRWTPPDGVVNAQTLVDVALANAMYAVITVV